MNHLNLSMPVPRYDAVSDPPTSGPEFPGCKPVHLPHDEVETFDGRLEFWDARTETAWVCEPTSPYHEQPSQTLAAPDPCDRRGAGLSHQVLRGDGPAGP